MNNWLKMFVSDCFWGGQLSFLAQVEAAGWMGTIVGTHRTKSSQRLCGGSFQG